MSETAGVSRREGLLAAAILGAWWIGLALWDGAALMRRRFWLDELCCTVYPLRDASNPLEVVRHALQSDVAPPLLHLILWPVTALAGSSPPVVRSVMLASVAFATILLYVVLRRRFAVVPSAAGVLAVLSNSLVITHAFEARFYGPWLFFAVAFAWTLGLDAGKASRRRDLLLALLAVCLCTLHWFGVTSLALLVAGALAAHGARWREGVRLVAPSAAGPLVLLALLPAMFGQLRVGGDALLWVPGLNRSQWMQMAQLFWIRLPLAVALALLLLAQLFPRLTGRGRPAARVMAVLRDPAFAALAATVLMPLVLVLITVVLEPVMVPRYAIVAALATAPIVALAFETVGGVGRGVIAFVYAAFLVGFADRELRQVEYSESVMDAYEQAFREARGIDSTLPLVFHSYFIVYPVDGNARQQSAARVLELSDSALDSLFPDTGMAAEKHRLKRDRGVVRIHERIFGFPITVTLAALHAAPRFVLFARDEDLPFGHRDAVALGQRLFPAHAGRRVNGIATVFERSR